MAPALRTSTTCQFHVSTLRANITCQQRVQKLVSACQKCQHLACQATSHLAHSPLGNCLLLPAVAFLSLRLTAAACRPRTPASLSGMESSIYTSDADTLCRVAKLAVFPHLHLKIRHPLRESKCPFPRSCCRNPPALVRERVGGRQVVPLLQMTKWQVISW